MTLDIDELEKNIRRWNAVSPMTAAALIEAYRASQAENAALRALLKQHEERARRAKLL